MKKQTADKMIFEYRDRIFGFALEKMRNIDQSRELASDIVYEVYLSFLRADDIANPDGYVYRIARNVYAKYIQKLETGRQFESINDMVIAAPPDTTEEEAETIAALRREIGYLSERQRLVIYMHYYDKLSVSEISNRLGISSGTVKWHLSDARSKLKAGMDMNINEQNLDINPIKFISMGHAGNPGSAGDTSDMFDTRLKQNIAWACYREPKTLEEIARTVGVPQVYVADDLAKLVDFAYIDKMDNSKNPKYRTNMLITDMRDFPSIFEIYDSAAEQLCEKYIPAVLEQFENDPDHWHLTCDGNDINFLRYNVVMLSLFCLFLVDPPRDPVEYRVKRPDGGEFIALAVVHDDSVEEVTMDKDLYWCCGFMGRGACCWDAEECRTHPDEAFHSVSADCRFTDRSEGWTDNFQTDWVWLVRFMNHGKDSLSAEEYKRLCDKGYIYEDRVQPAVLKVRLEDGQLLGWYPDYFIKNTVTVPEEIAALAAQTDKKMYDTIKDYFPEHILPEVKFIWATNALGNPQMLPRVIEKLLDRGVLQPLTDIQKKSVFSILCIQG